MKKNLIRGALMGILAVWGASINAQTVEDAPFEYHLQHYSVDNGLSQNTVTAILQDQEGYLWLGTWDGLNKFDGNTFTTYKVRPDTRHRLQNCRYIWLYEDQKGFIWSQTYDGNLFRFDKQTEGFFVLDEPVLALHNRVQRAFVEGKAGEMWFLGTQEVLCLTSDGDTVSVKRYPADPTGHWIEKDEQGNIWFDQGNRLCQITPTGERKEHTPFLEEGILYPVGLVQENELYVGTSKGQVGRYDLKKEHWEKVVSVPNAVLTDLEVTSTGLVIATTSAQGFFCYDCHSRQMHLYNKENNAQIKSNCFTQVVEDSKGVCWIENTEKGVFRFLPQSQNLKHLQCPADKRFEQLLSPNFLLLEDTHKESWINAHGSGFARYNSLRDELECPIGEISNAIHTAYIDHEGNLWVATYDQGVDRVSREARPFICHNTMEGRQLGEVRAILELQDGNVLLATKDAQLLLCDPQLEPIRRFDVGEMVYAMHEDQAGNLWLGTKGKGLIQVQKEGNSWARQQYQHKAGEPMSLSADNVYSLAQDKEGNLYVGTYGKGIDILHEGQFMSACDEWPTYPQEQASQIRDMLILNDTLWGATTLGLLQVDLNTQECLFTPYYDIIHLYQDEEKNLWLSTYGAGLNKLAQAATAHSPAIFEAYTTQNNMRSDIVLSVAEDESGLLWVVSENHISRFDDVKGTIQHFDALHSKGCHFGETPIVRLKSGKMVVGYNKGVCEFIPQRVLQDESKPRLVLTDLLLFNKRVSPKEENSPLQKSITYTDTLVLRHDQNVFTLNFATLNFGQNQGIRYAYKLEGLEEEWNYTNSRSVTYTNLKKGMYCFKVRSTNEAGIWVENTRALVIQIQPSFWQTGWAIALYILLFIGGILLLVKILVTYGNLERKVEMEKQITDIKLRFFTNISHELRTPLTLIAGPVENVLTTEKISPAVREQLEIVKSNCSRMLRLINEILDFRKIQNQKMRLRVQETKLAGIVEKACSNFSKEAYEKHIHFEIQNTAPDLKVWVDSEKVDTILYNLLSNAFKFTPAGKGIQVSVSEKPNFAVIQVSDEGVGIPKDKRGLLFERFTSQNEIKNYTNTASTGIGLNLVKELVDLHKGYIEVKSEPNKGTTFTILLRLGKEHFGSEVDFVSPSKTLVTDNSTPQTTATPESTDKKKQTMLIVEDNQDMRQFLSSIFNAQYHVVGACDGKEGVAMALETTPDMIITDLMMPNMDGLELTDKLKTDPKTSHIPIILLTAKTAVESRLEALRFGADDYLTKPFSPEELKARVENILLQRKRLQESYRNNLLRLQPKEVQTDSPNEAFLAKLMDFMERNMDNSELVVEDLVSEMALGRTVFFNKLKSLTGLSPVEFIREVRIKRAAQLLEQSGYNITEITYMVGMSDSRYFSKCFKGIYGVTPSEYKKQQGK